jgi:hypothetical protein
MRRLLLVGAAVLAFSSPARAQHIVFDPTLNTQTIINAAKDATYWAKQVADMYRDYTTLMSVYNAVAHANDFGQFANALGLATQTYMPDAGAIPQMFVGIGSLYGQAAAFRDVNQLFGITQTAGVMADEMLRQENVTANAQAFADQSGLDAQIQNIKLGILQAALNAAPDIQATAYIQGQIELIQNNMTIKQAQQQNIALLMAAVDRVTRQREEQLRAQSAQALFDQTAAVTDTME